MSAARWGRRIAAAVALAGFAITGFVHVFEPDPEYHGGLRQPAVVTGFPHAHPSGPQYHGG